MIVDFRLTQEQGRELRSTTIRAGIYVYGSNRGFEGRLGLLVTDAQGRFFALVTHSIVAPGEAALTGEGQDAFRLGLARGLKLHPEPTGFQSVSSLISAVRLGVKLQLNATVGGGSPQRVVASVLEAMRRPLRLAVDGRQVELGAIVAHSATTYFAEADGTTVPYKGALILGYSASYPALADGDAGAMVVTPEGVPVAMVVGGNKHGLVAVPLEELLRRNKMRPITQYDVARRVGGDDRAATPEATREEEDASGALDQGSSPILDGRPPSEKTLSRFEGLVQRMRSAQLTEA